MVYIRVILYAHPKHLHLGNLCMDLFSQWLVWNESGYSYQVFIQFLTLPQTNKSTRNILTSGKLMHGFPISPRFGISEHERALKISLPLCEAEQSKTTQDLVVK